MKSFNKEEGLACIKYKLVERSHIAIAYQVLHGNRREEASSILQGLTAWGAELG